ncbi:MAG: hypothetical protein ACJ79A_12195 [Gemmatimonadaceae bacterium]
MSRRSLALGSLLAAVFVAACHEPITSPASAPLAPSASLHSLAAGTRLTLPATAPSGDRLFSEYGRRAINPGDYVCSSGSPVIDVVEGEIVRTLSASAAEADRFWLMYDLAADLVPTYEALFFQTTAAPQTFGYNGEFTRVMAKTERDVKSFWDIPSSQIQVLGMHGTMLLDVQRVSATYQAVFGLDKPTSDFYAGLVRNALRTSTTMNGGNYAFWTFNSVSFRFDGLPDKIVMGDGILEAFASIGFSDVAPQAIFAHEYAHQIQFENDYFDDLGAVTRPERTRYSELMADAMSAYFLTHARGGAMNQKRVEQFLQIFYQIGDCEFTDAGHHGTPNQRMKAAQFGFTLADEAQKQGHILTSAEFHAQFLAFYPTLIAPDAP